MQPDDRHSQSANLSNGSGERSKLVEGKGPQAAIRVEIYVADHCQVCEYAYEIAGTIAAKYPDVDLRIINLSQTTQPIPDAVFATPTYLLNGRLWSLGNPSNEDIEARLSPASQKTGPTLRRNNNEG